MNKDTIICRCGAENPKEYKFCFSCGSILKAPEALVKKCPQCSSVFESEFVFCGNCGTRLVAEGIEEKKEEPSTPYVCLLCGTEIDHEFDFCTACGAKLEKHNTEKECRVCKTECAPNADFCFSCGASFRTHSNTTKNIEDKEIRKSKYDFKKIICSSVLLALSLILFLFSFMPIFKQTLEIDDYEQPFSFKLNSYESIGFMFDTLKNQSDKDIENSSLYVEFEELTDNISSIEDESLSKSEKKLLSRWLKTIYKMVLRHEDFSFSFIVFAQGLASITYVVLSTLAFIFAIFTFISVFNGKKSQFNKCIKCFIFAPFMLLITAIGYKLSFNLNNATSIPYEVSKISHPAVITAAILSATVIVGIIVQRIFFEKKGFSVKSTVLNVIIASVAISTALLCTSNVIRASVNAEFKNRTSASTTKHGIDASFYEHLGFEWKSSEEYTNELEDLFKESKDTKQAKKEHLLNILSSYSSYTVKEVKDGDANYVTNSALFTCLMLWNSDYILTFSYASSLFFITAVFALLIAALAFLNLAYGTDNSRFSITFAIPCATTAITAFVMNLLFVLTVNKAIFYYRISSSIKIKIALGAIFLVAFSIMLLIICSLNKSKEDIGEENSDDFNCSYDYAV